MGHTQFIYNQIDLTNRQWVDNPWLMQADTNAYGVAFGNTGYSIPANINNKFIIQGFGAGLWINQSGSQGVHADVTNAGGFFITGGGSAGVHADVTNAGGFIITGDGGTGLRYNGYTSANGGVQFDMRSPDLSSFGFKCYANGGEILLQHEGGQPIYLNQNGNTSATLSNIQLLTRVAPVILGAGLNWQPTDATGGRIVSIKSIDGVHVSNGTQSVTGATASGSITIANESLDSTGVIFSNTTGDFDISNYDTLKDINITSARDINIIASRYVHIIPAPIITLSVVEYGAITKHFVDSPVSPMASYAVYNCDTSGGAMVVNLPAIDGSTIINGRSFFIKNTGVNTLTINGNGSQVIDDNITQVITQYESVQLVAVIDGINNYWIVV